MRVGGHTSGVDMCAARPVRQRRGVLGLVDGGFGRSIPPFRCELDTGASDAPGDEVRRPCLVVTTSIITFTGWPHRAHDRCRHAFALNEDWLATSGVPLLSWLATIGGTCTSQVSRS